MYRILEFIIAAIITVLLFLLIGVFLPSHARVERSVELGNPMTQVYDTLNHFKRFNSWQPWYALDPRAEYALEGAEFGVGAKVGWNSILNKQVGKGSVEITESVPEERIVMSLDNPWRGHNKTMTFDLEQSTQTNAVTVKWAIDVEYGWDILGRYAGLYLNGRQGELMNEGLGRLASIMATVPNVDYSQVEVTMVDVTPTDLLYVGVSTPAAPREWDAAAEAMGKGWDEIDAFIEKNKLTATGPDRRIINVLGEETNDFNVAVPVAPHAIPVSGNIQAGLSYGGRALTTQYRGHRVGLQKGRDMLKAYALTHGYDFDRELAGLWENWLPATEEENTDTLTDIFLPIR